MYLTEDNVLEKVRTILQDVSNVTLKNNYDAVLIKELSDTNIINSNTPSSSGQSHIALTGKNSFDFFPYINTVHYTDINQSLQNMKSFYILQVPINIYKENVNYANKNNEGQKLYTGAKKNKFEDKERYKDIYFNFSDNNFITTYASVKLSRPKDPQMEFGNTGEEISDENFINFRKLFFPNDFLIILKIKNSLTYDAFIIKNTDARTYKLSSNTFFLPTNKSNTIIKIDQYYKSNYPNYEKLFIEWLEDNYSHLKKTESSIKTLNNFIDEVNQKLNINLDIWTNPISFAHEYGKEDIVKLAKKLPSPINTSYVRYDEKGGTTLQAIYSKYLEWAKQLISIDKPHQLIFSGAPGTGKSYTLNKWANVYFKDGNNSYYERVTFHPNMTYGQFVGVFKPFPSGDSNSPITYKFVPGVLLKQLEKAYKNPEKKYLILIEEINRANVASVFGDVFQLLDRKDGVSEYPISIPEDILLRFYDKKDGILGKNTNISEEIQEKLNNEGLFFPTNLYIWASMNGADQGVMPMDTAFKRRWEFEKFDVNDLGEVDAEFFDDKFIKYNHGEVSWNELRKALNSRMLELKIPEDKLMGPYFLSRETLEDTDKLTKSFESKVLMYLFDDAAKMKRKDFFNLEYKDMYYSALVNSFRELGINVFNEISVNDVDAQES